MLTAVEITCPCGTPLKLAGSALACTDAQSEDTVKCDTSVPCSLTLAA